MKEIELVRKMIQTISKSGTKAEIVILIFSELNEEGEIIKCADFRYISNIIGRTSYYEGIRKLKEKGIIPKKEQIVSGSGITVSENEQRQIMSENEQNVSVSENEQNISVSENEQNISVLKSDTDISKSEQNIVVSENEQFVSKNEQKQIVSENEQISKIIKEKNISEPEEEKKTPTMEELLALF